MARSTAYKCEFLCDEAVRKAQTQRNPVPGCPGCPGWPLMGFPLSDGREKNRSPNWKIRCYKPGICWSREGPRGGLGWSGHSDPHPLLEIIVQAISPSDVISVLASWGLHIILWSEVEENRLFSVVLCSDKDNLVLSNLLNFQLSPVNKYSIKYPKRWIKGQRG